MICVTKHQIKLNCDIDTLTISLSNNHPHELYYTQKKKNPNCIEWGNNLDIQIKKYLKKKST